MFHTLVVDSFSSTLSSEKLLNYDWSAGYHILQIGEKKYLVSQKNDTQFVLHNLLSGTEKKPLIQSIKYMVLQLGIHQFIICLTTPIRL